MSSEVITQGENSNVSCLLIPLHDKQLVLPNVTVAEIIPYKEPSKVAGVENWYLGKLEWRNIEIPVISYEILNSGDLPPLDGARLAIVNGTDSRLPFYAVLIQGIPKLIHVHEDEIVAVESVNTSLYDQMAVTVFGEQAMIPNLGMMEYELLK